jgi:hypothetical protein
MLSVTVITGTAERRSRIPVSWLGRLGSRCWARTIGAGKFSGRPETRMPSASMPPAEEPTTTRWLDSEP